MYLNQFCLIKNIILKKGLWDSKDYYFNVYFILRVKYYLVSWPWILSSMSFEHQVFPHSWTTLSSSYPLFSLSISSPPLLIYRKKWKKLSLLSSVPLVKTKVFFAELVHWAALCFHLTGSLTDTLLSLPTEPSSLFSCSFSDFCDSPSPSITTIWWCFLGILVLFFTRMTP